MDIKSVEGWSVKSGSTRYGVRGHTSSRKTLLLCQSHSAETFYITTSSHLLDSPEAVQRFHHEVQAAARLIHPNIVAAFDAGEHDGMHYLVMEYVDGQDLGRVVKDQGPLPVDRAVD